MVITVAKAKRFNQKREVGVGGCAIGYKVCSKRLRPNGISAETSRE